MTTRTVNLLWKNFKGIRTLNTINSDTEFGADIAHNVRLSKEKSGEMRSLVTSGWFEEYATMTEPVIRLVSANISGYTDAEQFIAFTDDGSNINAWLIKENIDGSITTTKIGIFAGQQDVTDTCMVQIGDYLGLAIAFGTNKLGFIIYSTTSPTIADVTWASLGNWRYGFDTIDDTTNHATVQNITSVRQYGSRLAINGEIVYSSGNEPTKEEHLYGVWFSEAGVPTKFAATYMDSATDTSAFYAPTGDKINPKKPLHKPLKKPQQPSLLLLSQGPVNKL